MKDITHIHFSNNSPYTIQTTWDKGTQINIRSKEEQEMSKKLKTLHNCNENTIIDGAYYDKDYNEVIILFSNTREYTDPFNDEKRVGTFHEYISFNKNYTWSCRVGYFCGVEEQIQHFNSLTRLQKLS